MSGVDLSTKHELMTGRAPTPIYPTSLSCYKMFFPSKSNEWAKLPTQTNIEKMSLFGKVEAEGEWGQEGSVLCWYFVFGKSIKICCWSCLMNSWNLFTFYTILAFTNAYSPINCVCLWFVDKFLLINFCW